MGKFRGFIESDRKLPSRRPVDERLGDWREVYEVQPEAETREQAGRCMDCGVPFCQQGCPLGNLIPDWNHRISEGGWREAWKRLAATNNFPEFTGRLCPAPCETACTLAINTGAITIEQVEKQIIEHAWAQGWPMPRTRRPSTGKRVAIVGSGPAGLAAAEQLAVAGHDVTVFERDERVGGLLRFGIPDFKLEKWVIDRRLSLIEAIGVSFRTSVEVGVDISWSEMRSSYDAVLLAIGAMKARELDVPGRDLDGVHLAMEYLTAQNRATTDENTSAMSAKGKHVVILGGGDTGSDCLGTAHRQGAASVTQIEIMPPPPKTRGVENPWPQWPMTFRTSSSHEEGGERAFALRTIKLAGDGAVKTLIAERVTLSETPGDPFKATGETLELDCDLLLLSLGFLGPLADGLRDELDITLTARGAINANKFATNVDGIYVAGDAMRGASLIVWAISDGREAARAIDADLCGRGSELPTRGIDQPYGGR
ncbi:MAG: glutamate synthase (NADPH/NADH) small chain [Bradymonadia bacterium]|jgi:glutamate synthase (NADPH/NADH) small chain